MKRAAAALFVVCVAAACGKVGDPKPPMNRTPQPVGDLSVQQSGDKVTLFWTNPSRYVDSNGATDLAFVRILRDGVEIAKEPVSAPGKPQSREFDIGPNTLNSTLSFAIQIETQRGKVSAQSNLVPIRPVDVPGVPRNLQAKTDQLRIILDWEPPERNPELATLYVVRRSDRPAPFPPVKERHFEDAEFEKDKKYEYIVTAVREPERIPGPSGAKVTVTAQDKTKPLPPTGLTVSALGEIIFLQWERNAERDVTEYRVYRSDNPDKAFETTGVDAARDETPKPGLSYWLTAVDESGNESDKSPSQPGP